MMKGLKICYLTASLFLGLNQVALAQQGSGEDHAQITNVVCASYGGEELTEGSSIVVLKLLKTADGWDILGDFANREVLVKDKSRFTVIGPNYLISVYHKRGAFIGVTETIPLFCKQLPQDRA